MDALIRIVFWLTLFSIMVPLSVQIGFARIGVFCIPVFGLMCLSALKAFRHLRLGALHYWDVLVLVFGLQVILATLANSPDARSAGYLVLWLFGLPLGLIASHEFGGAIAKRDIFGFAGFAGTLEAGLGAVQMLTGSTVGSLQEYFGRTELTKAFETAGVARPVGTFSTANTFALWQLMMLSLLLARVWDSAAQRKGRPSYSLLLATGVVFASVILTITRGAIIIATLLVVSSIVVGRAVMRFERGNRRRLAARVLRITMILLLAAMIGHSYVSGRLGFDPLRYATALLIRTSESGEAASFRERMDRVAIQQSASAPVWGMGFRNSEKMWANAGAGFGVHWIYRPHNIYLVFLVEAGVPGAVLFLVVIGAPLVAFLRTRGRSDVQLIGIAGAAIAMLLGGLIYTEVLEQEVWPMLMVLLGCLIGASRLRVQSPAPEVSQ